VGQDSDLFDLPDSVLEAYRREAEEIGRLKALEELRRRR
jgi:hypothetical protein